MPKFISKTEIDNLFVVAETARHLTEEFAYKHDGIGDIHNLECYCAIGSRILFLLAQQLNIPVVFIQGFFGTKQSFDYQLSNDTLRDHMINHCWIQYKKTLVIDITATQFGIKEKVYLKTLSEADCHHPIYFHDMFDSNWREQNPNKYMKDINRLVKKGIVELSA